MPRPTDKKSLLGLSQKNFNSLMDIAMIIPANEKMDLNGRDNNVRDVLTHLHEWHLMMRDWYKVGMGGKKPAIPREGYTWQTLPAMNRVIWEKYQKNASAKAFDLVRQSHADIMSLVEKHTDEELFTKRKYPWTGTTSLGAYFISSLSSHYDWAIKTLKPMKKKLGL